MEDLKFACPQCQQHIQCGPEYAGMEIACPSCKTHMIVPGTPPAPASAPAYAPPPGPPSAAGPPTGNCPSCGAPMPRGAVLCTRCGFNKATGQRTSPGMASARGGAVAAPAGPDKWYANPYIYLGVVAAIFAGLYALAVTGGPIMKLPFLGAALIYFLGMYVMVVVLGFKAGATEGIMCIICGIYQIYFVFKEDQSNAVKGFFAFQLPIFLAMKYGLGGD